MHFIPAVFMPMDRNAFSYGCTRVRVESGTTEYGETHIESQFACNTVLCSPRGDAGEHEVVLKPQTETYTFRTSTEVPKTGLMMVGWGGNNGSTLTAALLAHRKGLTWRTSRGAQSPNYLGSMLMSGTMNIGSQEGKPVYVPFRSVLPMINPEDLVVGGWDISSLNLGDSMDRACVLEPDLKRQLYADMRKMKPLPSIYDPRFIACNQKDRADNLIGEERKWDQMEAIRRDIREFRKKHSLDKVVVVWTANTERFTEVVAGVNGTADALLESIKLSHSEVSPSTIFAVACILENVMFINGSPQNTFVPGAVELALRHNVPIAGDDFKSGQTKFKSVIADFLIKAGIKPISIVSYNHLGNNDGKNLSEPQQFHSKEVSKTSVIGDMVESNRTMYRKGEEPDHAIVIKYVPGVGDLKRALDEYESEIFMGGRSTVSVYNRCEDSLLAAPLIIDLVMLGDLLSRIQVRRGSTLFESLHPVFSQMSYLLKAPLVRKGTPVVNSFFSQRLGLENLFRAVLGLPPNTELDLENYMRKGPAGSQ